MNVVRLALVLALLAPVQASAASATPQPGFKAISLSDDGPAPWTPQWFADRDRVDLALYILKEEATRTRFGVRWPEGRRSDSRCTDYDGPTSFPGIDGWFFRCNSSNRLGQFDSYYYDLEGQGQPTLELTRTVVKAPPRSAPGLWRDVHRALAASLAKAMRATPSWAPDSVTARIDATSGCMFITLFVDAGTGEPESLDMEHLSADLLRISEERTEHWADGLAEEDSLRMARRAGVARALRPLAPRLSEALSRDSAVVADTSAVLDALRRSARKGLPDEQRDLLLYGAHLWLADQLAGRDDRDSAFAPALDGATRPYGAGLDESNDGWCYPSGLRDSLALRAGENRWTEAAFLEWLEDDSCDGPDRWRYVIERCEQFLARRPRSAIAADVLLHLGEAHETGWALSKMRPSWERGFHPEPYRMDAPAHRLKAIECYERYFASNPPVRDANIVRGRLVRLRVDVGTGFTRYYCEGC